jgi:hypothetical protein
LRGMSRRHGVNVDRDVIILLIVMSSSCSNSVLLSTPFTRASRGGGYVKD